MALTLTVFEGDSVYIGGKPLKIIVAEPNDPKNFGAGWYVVAEKPNGEQVELSEDQSVEVFPKVYVQLGTKTQPNKASIAFEAPPEIKILTEKNYNALHNRPQG